MALRKLETISNTKTGKAAAVYRDTENQEFLVRFYVDGKHRPEADYHTKDKSDAQSTARTVWREAK